MGLMFLLLGGVADRWRIYGVFINEERVARAVSFQLPIISAVGHEIDANYLPDFVADVRAATPSAAAELVSRHQQELLDQLFYRKQRLEMALDRFQQKVKLLQRLQFSTWQQHPQSQLNIQQKNDATITSSFTSCVKYVCR